MAFPHDDPTASMVSTLPVAPASTEGASRRLVTGATLHAFRAKIVTETVYHPEIDGEFILMAITQEQLRNAQRFCWAYDERTKMRIPEADQDMNIALLIESAVNAEGKQAFNYGQYAELQKWPAAVINRNATIIARISGLDEDVLGKQKRRKDFFETESGGRSAP